MIHFISIFIELFQPQLGQQGASADIVPMHLMQLSYAFCGDKLLAPAPVRPLTTTILYHVTRVHDCLDKVCRHIQDEVVNSNTVKIICALGRAQTSTTRSRRA